MPWSFFTNTGSLKISAVPTSATVLSAQPVLETGISNQRRAGRVLTVADFTTLLALPTTPAGLFNLTTTANLGSGGTTLMLQVRLTPSAPARAYAIRAWRATSNGEWSTSSGSTSADSGQGFIRIERDI